MWPTGPEGPPDVQKVTWQHAAPHPDRVPAAPTRLPAQANRLGHTAPPLLTGVAGRRDADLLALARRGAALLGSLGAVRDGRLRFVDDLHDSLR